MEIKIKLPDNFLDDDFDMLAFVHAETVKALQKIMDEENQRLEQEILNGTGEGKPIGILEAGHT